jgi:hypothetical protein
VPPISVLRTFTDGTSETIEFDELSEVRQAVAGWSWPDGAATEIRSEVFGEEDLVGALPVDLGDVEQNDEASDELELPLGDDGRVFAPVTVNGYRWALVNQPEWAWVPVPFWEYPGLQTIYEVETSTADGAEWSERLFQVPGLIVRLTYESHANSRTGGDWVLSLEAGTADRDFHSWDIPEPYLPDDKFERIDIAAPALGPEAAQALVDTLAEQCAPGADVRVNEISIQTEGEGEEEDSED